MAAATAQQLPPGRCGAAVTCQPSGFQTLFDDAGETASFFGVSSRFGHGLEFGLVHPHGWRDPFSSLDPVAAAADIFVRRHPLKMKAHSGPPGDPSRPTGPAVPASDRRSENPGPAGP